MRDSLQVLSLALANGLTTLWRVSDATPCSLLDAFPKEGAIRHCDLTVVNRKYRSENVYDGGEVTRCQGVGVGNSLRVTVRHRTVHEVIGAEVASSHTNVDDSTVICEHESICLKEILV